MSLATIPKEKMAQASGISNTVRQIGGSLGVAMLTTILTERVNFHAQIYGSAIETHSDAFKNTIRNLAYHIQHAAGSSYSSAVMQGRSALLSQIHTQAFIAGVNDDFLIATLITLLGFIPIFLMRSRKKALRLAEEKKMNL